MNTQQYLIQLDQFGAHYRYDLGYVRDFLHASPEGYAKLAGFGPLAGHREQLPLTFYWVAKLAASRVSDCGECLQLAVRMAIEAGIDAQLVQACLEADELSEACQAVFDFATDLAQHRSSDPAVRERVTALLTPVQLAELGISVASAAMYPTIKRALGLAEACSLVAVEYTA